MAFTAQLRYLSPDHFKVFQRTAAIVVQGEPSACDGTAQTAFTGFSITDVNSRVSGVVCVQHHITQPTLGVVSLFRHATVIAPLVSSGIVIVTGLRNLYVLTTHDC